MEEFCKKIFMRIQAGDKKGDIAKRFMVDPKTVWCVEQLYKETGGFKDRARTGRLRTMQSEAKIAAIKDDIERNLAKSEVELAKDHELNKMDTSCVVREDLGMKSCAMAKVQLLMANQRQKRLECHKKILDFLRRGKDKVLGFSDEEIFTVDAVGYSRTKWYIAKKPKDVPAEV